MSYSTSNSPQLLFRPMAVQTSTLAVMGATGLSGSVYGGMGLWLYQSTEASTVSQNVGYFTNGKDLGMRTGDVMITQYFSSLGATPSGMQIGIVGTTNSTAGFNVITGANIASS